MGQWKKTNCFWIPDSSVFWKDFWYWHFIEYPSSNQRTSLPLDKLFIISIDRPNINKTVWREINDTLKKEGFSGLIPQSTCCLNIVHHAFRKGLNIYGEESEELAFNIHYGFKNAPCKRDDFLKLEREMDMEIYQSLFLRHINS